MSCERPNALNLLGDWARRVGLRLDRNLGHCDPIKKLNLRLFPNSPRKTRFWLFGAPPPNNGSIAMAFIGVDLHTNSFTICRLEADGSEVFATFQLSASDLDKFCMSLDADDELAVEATGNTSWFCDEVRACVGRIVVVNPRQFTVIQKSVKKTDRNNARALAFFLSKDMLPETRLKSTAQAELSLVVQKRDLLVKQRTMLLNKFHAMFVRRGMKLKKESLASKKRLRGLDLNQFKALEQAELDVLRNQAFVLTETLSRLDRIIEEAAAAMAGFEELTSITGIGPRSAAVLLAEIGNADDFPDADTLAAYVGIVPKVSNSNETEHHGRITKRGDKLMRTTLVQCTWIAIRYSEYLNSHYQRIKERRGAEKTIIATARKLLKIIYDTLKDGWILEDFQRSKSNIINVLLDIHHWRRLPNDPRTQDLYFQTGHRRCLDG